MTCRATIIWDSFDQSKPSQIIIVTCCILVFLIIIWESLSTSLSQACLQTLRVYFFFFIISFLIKKESKKITARSMSDDESTQVIIEDVQSPWHKKMMETAYREHEHAAKQRYLWTQRVQRLTPKGPLVIITAYQKLHLDTARKNVSHWRNIEQAAYERMTLLRDAYKIWLADRAE